MLNKPLALGTALFSFGLLTGIAGTAIWAISKQDDSATRLIASSKAQNSDLLSGLVTLSDEADLDLYIENRARTAQEKQAIEITLRGIAHRRDGLRLGAYAEEQNDISNRIESILSKYDPPPN